MGMWEYGKKLLATKISKSKDKDKDYKVVNTRGKP
jgi:hypothetical protein